jgi:hypothetical protein
MLPAFPGMNPYLEDSAIWSDYHTTLLLHLRASINKDLPVNYVARIGNAATAVIALGAPAVSTMPAIRRKGHAYLKIVDAQGRRVVTVVEILSPSNKSPGEDRDAYLAKRGEYLASGANFVEINLLRGGRQSPMGKPAPPPSDYSIVISQAAEFPKAGVWPIGLRDRLPTIRIPLSAGEKPIYADLQACHEQSCLEGQYGKDIDYSLPPPAPPLSAEDAAWLAELVGR